MAAETASRPSWYLSARTTKWHKAICQIGAWRILTVCSLQINVTVGVAPRRADQVPAGEMCSHCARNGGPG